MMANCEYCHKPLPDDKRAGAKYCDNPCRQGSYALRRTLRDLDPLEQLKLAVSNIHTLESRLQLAQEHCRELINRHNLNRNPAAKAILGDDMDWPDDSRIDVIGSNGNDGLHY